MTRNRRAAILGGVVRVAIVVVVVAVVVSGGGGSSATTISAAPAVTTGAAGTSPAPSTTFAGVPQRGDVLGKASASATLLVYEDPQCPYCQQWSLNVLPTVVDRFVRAGKVKLRWRGVAIVSANSDQGLAAAYAAARQNKLWDLVEQLYVRQGQERSGWITDAVVSAAAAAAGADPAKVLTDAKLASVAAAYASSKAEFSSFGLNSTPSFVLEQGMNRPVEIPTSLDPSAFATALEAALSS